MMRQKLIYVDSASMTYTPRQIWQACERLAKIKTSKLKAAERRQLVALGNVRLETGVERKARLAKARVKAKEARAAKLANQLHDSLSVSVDSTSTDPTSGKVSPKRADRVTILATSKGRYSSRCTYMRYEHRAVIEATPRLLSALQPNSGNIVLNFEGMPTLYNPLKLVNQRVAAAYWIVKGRGYDRSLEKGFIAQVGTQIAHAETKQEAIALATKRSRRVEAQFNKKDITPVEILQKRVVRLKPYWHLNVTIEDSLQSGNCATGTKDWAAKHADGAKCAKIKDILLLALSTGDRVELAVAACEMAVKNHRKAIANSLRICA
jgi:hypothetical protein